jgi:hypothetical protein
MCSTPSAYSHTQDEISARQSSDAAYDFRVGDLRHFVGVRVGDDHLALLEALENASGFTRGEILRRLILTADIPSARTLQEVQDLLRIQREQNRLGGLLKTRTAGDRQRDHVSRGHQDWLPVCVHACAPRAVSAGPGHFHEHQHDEDNQARLARPASLAPSRSRLTNVGAVEVQP